MMVFLRALILFGNQRSFFMFEKPIESEGCLNGYAPASHYSLRIPGGYLYTIIPPSDVNTAGVLLREAGRFVFCYGPHASGGIYVLRIGGHRETGESPWACAVREAREEAAAVVHQIPAHVSVQTNGMHGRIDTLSWPAVVEGYPQERPLVVGGSVEPGAEKSTLFLAETTDVSHPSGEVFGLAKLTAEQVVEVARVSLTFATIEDSAESQHPNTRIPGNTPLVVSSHLRALAYCLERGYV